MLGQPREAEELQNAQDVAAKIGGLSIAIAVKTGSGGKLFGSVTASQIIEKVSEKGFSLDKKHFNNFAPIKKPRPNNCAFVSLEGGHCGIESRGSFGKPHRGRGIIYLQSA